jgi:ABC-type proline/glycine betaine transport system permease subunit
LADREDALALTLISVLIGLALAVVYHLLSMRLQRWVARRSSTMVPVVTVLGFVVRLAFFALILVVIGLWTPLNILALCLAFVALFTVLNGISLYVLLTKRPDAPTSADAGGAK